MMRLGSSIILGGPYITLKASAENNHNNLAKATIKLETEIQSTMSNGLHNRNLNKLHGEDILGDWHRCSPNNWHDPLLVDDDDSDDEASTTPLVGSKSNSSCRKVLIKLVNAEHVFEEALWQGFLKLDSTMERWERLVHRSNEAVTESCSCDHEKEPNKED